MRYSDERRIRNAIRRGDEHELRQAVDRMYRPRFDEVERVVARTPGGRRYRHIGEIRMGDTAIRNRFGRADVRYPDDGYL